MNRAFRVADGSELFEEELWGQVIFHNERLASLRMTQLTKEELDTAIESGDLVEIEYNEDEALEVFALMHDKLLTEGETFFSSDGVEFLDDPVPLKFEEENRKGIADFVFESIGDIRYSSHERVLVIDIEAQMRPLVSYEEDDASTDMIVSFTMSVPILKPTAEDPMAFEEVKIAFDVYLRMSSIEMNTELAERLCEWLSKGLSARSCVVNLSDWND